MVGRDSVEPRTLTRPNPHKPRDTTRSAFTENQISADLGSHQRNGEAMAAVLPDPARARLALGPAWSGLHVQRVSSGVAKLRLGNSWKAINAEGLAAAPGSF